MGGVRDDGGRDGEHWVVVVMVIVPLMMRNRRLILFQPSLLAGYMTVKRHRPLGQQRAQQHNNGAGRVTITANMTPSNLCQHADNVIFSMVTADQLFVAMWRCGRRG